MDTSSTTCRFYSPGCSLVRSDLVEYQTLWLDAKYNWYGYLSCQDAKEQDTIIMSFNLALKPEIMDRALELGEGRTAKAIVN